MPPAADTVPAFGAEPAVPPRPARRPRARGRRTAAGLVLVAALVAGCGTGGGARDGAAVKPGRGAGTIVTPSPLAGAVRPLPSAPVTPDVPVAGPEPAALTVEALGVSGVAVRPVGVERDGGAMEIPPVDEVGWYRFGARPGDPGSTVLAAHVAYDGVDGVFRRLADLGAGDGVTVALSDGSSAAYVVTEIAQYPKSELPAAVWTREGDPQLVLVTCGGEFDTEPRSYTDNVVAFAQPA